MSAVNAFGALSLEATQAAVLAELQQKLEPGQSVVVSSIGGTVTVSGTVALDAATLAALEAIDVRQSGSWTVAIVDGGGSITVDGTVTALGPLTDTQLRATPVPVSGTIAVAEPVSVDDNGASLTTDGTYDERYSGGKTAFGTTVAAAGDTTLVTPPPGKAIRVVWVAAVPSSDNSAANLVKFKFGAAGTPFYQAYAVAHWEVFDGGVDVPLVANLATSESVAVTVHYRILP